VFIAPAAYKMTYLLGGGDCVTTAFYLFLGWLIFNVIFAAGMYFRPTRKPAVDSNESSESGLNVRRRPPDSVELVLDDDALAARGTASLRSINPWSSALSRIVFFGFWLGDRRHSI
jgi:hypothetical protein